MTLIRKYDQSLIRYLNLFEQISRVTAKDCISIGNSVFFFTERGTTKLAIGARGANVRKISDVLKRDVRILEWSDSAVGIIKSYLFPLYAVSIKPNPEGEIEIRFKTAMQRRFLLSNQQHKLKQLTSLVRNYFPSVKAIRVL